MIDVFQLKLVGVIAKAPNPPAAGDGTVRGRILSLLNVDCPKAGFPKGAFDVVNPVSPKTESAAG